MGGGWNPSLPREEATGKEEESIEPALDGGTRGGEGRGERGMRGGRERGERDKGREGEGERDEGREGEGERF